MTVYEYIIIVNNYVQFKHTVEEIRSVFGRWVLNIVYAGTIKTLKTTCYYWLIGGYD